MWLVPTAHGSYYLKGPGVPLSYLKDKSRPHFFEGSPSLELDFNLFDKTNPATFNFVSLVYGSEFASSNNIKIIIALISAKGRPSSPNQTSNLIAITSLIRFWVSFCSGARTPCHPVPERSERQFHHLVMKQINRKGFGVRARARYKKLPTENSTTLSSTCYNVFAAISPLASERDQKRHSC